MNSTLDYIARKFNLDLAQKKMPIEILEINRTIMAETVRELGFVVGAEIGVAQGFHAELLCRTIPELKLYGIDAWQGYAGYRDYLGERLAQFHADAKARLAGCNCELIQAFSLDAVKEFRDGELDFVYLDGAHDFKSVADDLCAWSNKVRAGGIVYGHDFKRSKSPRYVNHVVDVVQAYAYAHGIRPWFVLGTKGAHDGQYREGTRSWMWVKT